MTFLEKRIDPRITRGATVSVTVPGRTKTYLPNGSLFQNFNGTMAIHKFDLSHGLRSREDYLSVLDTFYLIMLTPYEGLRLKNWQDFQGTLTNTALTNITGSTWQLQRKHSFGGQTFLRDIFKPVAGTVVVYDSGGSALTSSVDPTTGIATVTGTPAKWTGEFDIPVTFTDDDWTASLEVASDSVAWVTSGSVKLEEIRLS